MCTFNFKIHIRIIFAAICLYSPYSIAADALSEIPADNCFAVEIDKPDQLIEFFAIDFELAASSMSEAVDDSGPGEIVATIQYKERGLPMTVFHNAAVLCRTAGAQKFPDLKINCSPVCDTYGFLKLEFADKDNLEFAISSSTFVSEHKSIALADDGTFTSEMKGLLRRYPVNFCRQKAKDSGNLSQSAINLRLGDFGPLVGDVKKGLTKLGMLREGIDWTFTDKTANAVSAFQSSVGLPATSVVDVKTYNFLRVKALYSGC